jgi:serine/threonine-protein kinase HipA
MTRLGALRFRRSPSTPFLDDDDTLAAPAITSVRELQAISLRLEDEHAEEHPDYDKWLAQLVAPGSSLGGARPKAAVTDETGHLCLAKFPSRRDTHDVGAWEMIVHRLAAKAGIEVAEARPLSFGADGHTFLVRRFDRTETGGRRAYVSAMTLLQRQDGESGASYLEIVDLLQSRGARARVDCAQLFRRVVFNILVSNTDDHLRNHGFFMEPQGLVLSPAFDMNPNPERNELSLAIDEVDATCDPQVALRAASNYGLAMPEATAILKEVQASVATWPDEAAKLGIPRREQQRLGTAFR